jgi:hypothetical protein
MVAAVGSLTPPCGNPAKWRGVHQTNPAIGLDEERRWQLGLPNPGRSPRVAIESWIAQRAGMVIVLPT